MWKRCIPIALGAAFWAGSPATAQDLPSTTAAPAEEPKTPPNILLIVADDLGYGDVRCLRGKTKIQTPRIDQLAKEGILFTDAHSASSVSSPSRYAILTGCYPWRTDLDEGPLDGFAPVSIEAGRLTLPDALRVIDYTTAYIGIWNLQIGLDLSADDAGANRFTVTGGPQDAGFDYFYGTATSLGKAPVMVIENDAVVEAPPPAAESGESAHAAPPWNDLILGKLIDKAVAYLDQAGKREPGAPFFLYVAPPAPGSTPFPSAAFAGKSQVGTYGDSLAELDDGVGRILDALDRNGLAENTLVVFTSDNGSAMNKVKMEREFGHTPNLNWKGRKSDLWEGGHRVPFIVRWPGVTPAGTRSRITICHTDLMRTCAAAAGYSIREEGAEDSFDVSDAFKNPDLDRPVRDAVLHHGSSNELAIRQGAWKLIYSKGSGGWSYAGRETDKPIQLYNLDEDPGEKQSVFVENMQIVERLMGGLGNVEKRGSSRRNEASWLPPDS